MPNFLEIKKVVNLKIEIMEHRARQTATSRICTIWTFKMCGIGT
jgi:hypothetical protein